MATTKKVTKKVVPTVEDMILNNSKEQVEIHTVYDVFNANNAYKVTNLQLNNNPTIMSGSMVAQFFGYDNAQARLELEKGAKEVTLVEADGKGGTIPLYKIEVV